MFLYPIFDFFARNKWAQYLALGFAFLSAIMLYLWRRDEAVRKMQRAKDAVEAFKKIQKIEHESSTDADKADNARATAPRYPDPAGVPDEIAGRIFRD